MSPPILRRNDVCRAADRHDDNPDRRGARALDGRESSVDRNSRASRKEIKPDKFDGITSVAAFLEKFNTCAKYNRWNREDRYVHLKICLKGSAAGLL